MAASMNNESDGLSKKLVDSLSTVNAVIEEMIIHVKEIFSEEDRSLWHKTILGTDALPCVLKTS